MMIRVFIADDHEIVLQGLRSLLGAEEDIEVVGEASTAQEALARVAETKPDVAVLDVRLPDLNGVELCQRLRSEMPELKCLMFSAFEDAEVLLSSIRAGASGYVLKELRGNNLISAVRCVAAGGTLFDPAQMTRAIKRLQGTKHEDERIKWLTNQQRKILQMIADSKSNREIANELSLKEKTVKNYVSDILAKMGFTHRTEAAIYAVHLAEREKRNALRDTNYIRPEDDPIDCIEPHRAS